MTSPIKLEKANPSRNQLVVFLPGVSGKAHSRRYKPLVEVAHERGYDCARLELWHTHRELDSLSYEILFSDLNEIFTQFMKDGYERVILVGKSFGGGLSLVFQHELIVKKVLWAPAIGIAAGKGNFGDYFNVPFSEITDLLSVQVGGDYLSMQHLPVGIIHGKADEVISVDNSKIIQRFMPQTRLILVGGADHSFKKHVHEEQLMDATKSLLQ